MGVFDNRIVKIVFTYGSETATIDTSKDPTNPPMIMVQGSKYVDPTQNECTVQIANLSKPLRDALGTQITPYDAAQERKSVQIWAGRESTGMFLRYQGDIVTATVSQPPDLVLTATSKTLQFYKQDILAQSYSVTTPMSLISADVAKSLGLNLTFEATDRSISNYAYSGSSAGQIAKLNNLGGMDAYVDDGTLICKDRGQSLSNVSHTLSEDSGMVGQVELTEYGVRVRCMLSPDIKLGGTLVVKSVQNPTLNGSYTIYRTGFQIATRDVPFYDIIEATKYPSYYFTANFPT